MSSKNDVNTKDPPPVESDGRFWRKPLDLDRWGKVKGELTIYEDLCKGCGYCIEFCPLGVLGLSESLNSKGYHPPVVLHPDTCVGCGLCEKICPEMAIVAKKLEAVT